MNAEQQREFERLKEFERRMSAKDPYSVGFEFYAKQIPKFIEYNFSRTEQTKSDYERILLKFFFPLRDNLTHEYIIKYFSSFRAKKNTVRKYQNVLKNFMQFLTDSRIIDFNPTVTLKKIKITNKDVSPTVPIDLEDYFEMKYRIENNKLPNLEWHSVAIALLYAFRSCEIMNLDKWLYNPQTGVLSSGNEPTKNQRVIKRIIHELHRPIFERLYNSSRWRHTSGAKKGKLYSKEGFDKAIREKVKLRTGNKFTFHQLRATFASKMFSDGEPIEKIMDHLGHSDISVTKGYIFHFRQGYHVEAYDVLGKQIDINRYKPDLYTNTDIIDS